MNTKILRKLAPQIITVVLVLSVIGYFWLNAYTNMEIRGMDFGYDFLFKAASFDIQFSMIDYDGSSPYYKAYFVGLLNTLLVSAIGIFFATLLGITIGISRISKNILVSKLAEVYVELFRNIPLLLQIFFWYFAVLRSLPLPENALIIGNNIYVTIKGIYIPKFIML